MAKTAKDLPGDPLAIRQLPYSMEAEQSVLGALILDSEKFSDISSIISSEDFLLGAVSPRLSICST